MKGRGNPVANLIVLATAFLAFGGWLAAGAVVAVPIFVVGIYVSLSPRLLKEWERGALMVVPSDMVCSMGNLAAFAPAAFDPPGPRLADSAPDGADA